MLLSITETCEVGNIKSGEDYLRAKDRGKASKFFGSEGKAASLAYRRL